MRRFRRFDGGMANLLVVQTLTNKRAEIHCRVGTYEARITAVWDALAHTDATIRLFTEPRSSAPATWSATASSRRARPQTALRINVRGSVGPPRCRKVVDAALAAPVREQALINTIFTGVGRTNMPAERCAIDFHLADAFDLTHLCGQRFAQLSHKHKGRLVLYVEISGHLHHREPFRGVQEQADGAETIYEGKLAGREDRSRRDAQIGNDRRRI